MWAIQVSALVAIGMVEGFSHVNWSMVTRLLKWWVMGFALVVLCTAALVAQGAHPCAACCMPTLLHT